MRYNLGFGVGAIILGLTCAICGQNVPTGSSPSPAPGPRIICKPSDITPTRIVEPTYPKKAIEQNLQGKVVLELLVDKAGVPTEVTVLQGHPILADAAITAAKEWRYKPLRLNGVPVEGSMRAEFNFVLPNVRKRR